ncbi:MAG TPA: YhjD/YihY/BrkB family envelope integrity protein [Trueperaceae bacterium]|nr:YhjD/YihY/BrkB family envelope integrity protein [Trueperaceae bacterium]
MARPGAWRKGWTRAAWEFVRRVYDRYQESRLQMLAASLAYYGAFSLGPLLLLLAGWLAVFLRRRPELLAQYREALVSLLADALPIQVDAEALVRSSFDIVVGDLGRGAVIGSVVSVVVLVWASGNFFMSLQHALEVVFEVSERRGFWRKRLVSFLLVACVALVVAVEIVGGVALGAVSQLVARVGEWLGPGLPADLLGPVLDLGLLRLVTTTAGLTLAFRYLPRRGSTWLGALAGGGVAAVGILVVRSLLLLTFSPERFNLVYGVITSLLAVLLWLYLALLILLVGAAVAAELSFTAGRRPAAPGAVAEPG